jgi:ribosomal protein S18 acetylase RimI-like enzyme
VPLGAVEVSSRMFSNACLDTLTEADIEIVARLGEVIWRSHYAKMLSVAQIDYMLAGRYTPDKLCRYFNADDRWLELLKLAGKPVGYCSYARTSTPNEMKLEQLYLLRKHRGKGLGGFMLRHVEVQARRHGLSVLMLQVNKRNVEPIAFYHKAGFTVREEATFDIGNGFVMDDYVMVKML